MISNIFLRKISFLIFFVFCFSTFLYPLSETKAGNIKTVVITFNSAPTYANVTKTALKYNKDFAWSYSFDDGLIGGYDPAFKYMNGGYSDYLGQYFGGLYFTDGAGNNVPFRGGYAFYARNGSYSDIHINTPSYIKWTELQDSVDNGWNVFNHGYTSASLGVDDPNDSNYIGDPGGHAVGALDYMYELSQENVEVASHINLKNNAGTVVGPLNMSHVILPNGDDNYIQPAFDLGFKGVYAQSGVFPFTDGAATINAPDFTNVTNSIPTTGGRHVMSRWFDYENRYLSGGANPGGLFTHVDNLATASTGGTKLWSQQFTHQITTSTYAPHWNGGMTWSSWKSLMDHVENTYGRFGNDKAWVAGAEEVYNYMMVKQNSVLSQNLVGNQLTITIDTTNVPTGLNNYSLSLLVDSDATISSIDYGSDFTYHTDNKITGLINLDWGTNSYSKNDITRVETLVSTAEVSKRKSDIDVARAYVNLLTTNPTSIKTAYTARLDAIVVPLRTWYVNIKSISILSYCNDANGATTTKSYPSPNHPNYNWNLFTVGATSALSCGDLTNLRDSDNQISTLSLSNTAPFKAGGLNGYGINNAGLYPDTVTNENGHIYSSTNTPAKVKVYGLEDSKTYNIRLFGSTSATGATGNSAMTTYTVGGVSKDLTVKLNTVDYVDFLNILPVSGEIEVTVAPKVTAWGYGFLNAMEIKENILAAPSALSYSSPNTYTKNSAISSLSPTVTGLGITYSVSPSLPAGLSLNTSTGVISGTPTTASSLATYTVTATNNGGSASFGIAIAVNDIAPSSFSYSTPKVYTRGTAITSVSPTITGENIIYSVSPSLPAGLSLDESTGIISGNPSGVASLNIYTITASNSGGSVTFDITITVNDIPISSPVSSPSAGVYNGTQNVTLSSTGSDYIKYSTSSLPETCGDGTLYSSAISVSSSQTIYARACNVVGNSSTASFSYTIDTTPPEAPTPSVSAGSYNATQSVTLSAVGSTYIKYATDALPSSCSAGTSYTGAISVSSSQTIYARACDDAGNSSTASFAYVIDTVPPSSPTADPIAGSYNSTQNVTLSSTGSDYIKYSTLSLPETCGDGTLYSGAISVSSSQTIYVRACDTAGNSSTTSFAYVIDTVPPSSPTADPIAGSYNSTQNVTLSSTGSDYIKYSTSSLPSTCGDGTLYSTQISVSSNQTIYVRACDTAGNSSTASFEYTIDVDAPLTPIASVSSGTYNTTQSVTLSAVGSTYIKYATDENPSSCSAGNSYTEAISVSTSQTIYVRACDDTGNSSTASFAYIIDTIPPEAPTPSVSAGSYNTTQSVTLSAVGSTYIKYATDGTPSSCSAGTSYTGAISVSTSQTIYVRACDTVGNSSTASFIYIIDSVAPNTAVASSIAGTYNVAQSVSLSSNGSDFIRYATDEIPSSCSAGTSYTGAISVSSSQTIYVRACDDAGNSSTASFAYVIDTTPPEAPIPSVVAGSYNATQSVTLSAVGSTYIKYATDGVPSSCLSGTSYTGAISVSSSQTIYARACDDAGNSSTASFAYVIDADGGSNDSATYMKYSTTSTPSNCSNGILYSDSLTFPSSTKLYMRVCKVSDNSSVSTFEYTTPRGSSGGGSSGGSGSYIIRPSSITSTPTTVSTSLNTPTPVSVVSSSNIIALVKKIKKDLKIEMRNKDVKTLQLFLISQDKGPYAKKLKMNGSTDYFGKLTKSALSEWQKVNKISPASGYFGSKTRAKIMNMDL